MFLQMGHQMSMDTQSVLTQSCGVQNELDEIDPIALTSPWYPDRISMKDDFELDRIKYLRTKHPMYAEKNNFFEKIVKIFTPKRSDKEETKQKTKTIINPLKKIISLTMKPIKLMFKLYEEKVLIRTFTKKSHLLLRRWMLK